MRLYFAPFQRELASGVRNVKATYQLREGAILKIEFNDGSIRYGEASPLFPFSTESNLENIEILSRIKKEEILNQYFLYRSLPSSLLFAFDTIFLLPDLKTVSSQVQIAGFIPLASVTEMTNTLLEQAAKGMTVFKVKLVKKGFGELVKLINENNKYRFRLDANSGLAIEELLFFLKSIDHHNIDFIEDPLRDLSSLNQIPNRIPVAIDESVRSASDVRFFYSNERIDYYIVKPTVVGGIKESIDMLGEIYLSGKKAVLSSLFETELGLSALLEFSTKVPNQKLAHGLGTSNIFKETKNIESWLQTLSYQEVL